MASHSTGQTKQISLYRQYISYQELLLTKSKAILICPYWTSAPFWPLLASGQDMYFPFVKDVCLIENPATRIKLGDNKKSILGSPAYQGYFIATLMIK